MKKISVAIPFYNRSLFISDCLNNILSEDRINEIVIQDDFSDITEYQKLTEIITSFQNNFKIRIIRNQSNLGAYFNKLEAVKSCSNDWVILLDSDNYLFPSYLDSLFKEYPWEENYCYQADEMLANGNREPWGRCEGCWDHGRFGYEPIEFDHIKEIRKNDIGVEGLLNAGNYFFNRKYYIESASKILLEEEGIAKNPYACDCMCLMYYWLKSGGKLKILKNAEYYHRMHGDSLYMKLAQKSQIYSNYIMDRFFSEKID